MCGITGIVTSAGRQPDRDLVRRMADTLRHRGPDADGVWIHDNVGLGHRRLTIIDTSHAADQPQFNEDRSVALVFNGEIYNFQELRPELEAAGHRFTTRSDTEVLVHGWEEWGPRVLDRMRGMFAFALYDARAERLFLARDRIGKKPLFWAMTPQGFVFGSEIKALLEHPGVSRELDARAVGEYAVYGNTVGERTIYRGVRSLPPGHSLTLSTGAGAGVGAESAEPAIARYWRYRPAPDPGIDEAAWLDELDRTLDDAVRLRMISDVPLGAFLSGGVDSSLIVAYMTRHAPGRVQTFSVGFDEARWDETEHARAVAAHLGTDHHAEIVTPDALAILPELVALHDEPFADPSIIPTYYVCRETRRHVKVALSGDGGDELFMGYTRHLESATLERLAGWITPAGRMLARGLSRLLPLDSFTGRGLDRVSYRGFDLYHHALGFSRVYRSLLAPEIRDVLGPARCAPALGAFGRGEGLSFLQRCQVMDLETYLPDQILVKVDRASMHHSLEVRCPLLDQEVMAVAARMPAERQVGRRSQKMLLRRLAARYVPREVLDRPKQGFTPPLREWLRGPLAAPAAEAVADAASPAWDFLDRREALRRLEAHGSGRVDASTALWRVLVFYRWAERNL